MDEITTGDETTVVILDPLALKRRKNPWREKRTDFRATGPGKPHSSNGKVFLKKHLNRKIRQLPIINRTNDSIVPTIKRTVAFDLS